MKVIYKYMNAYLFNFSNYTKSSAVPGYDYMHQWLFQEFDRVSAKLFQ